MDGEGVKEDNAKLSRGSYGGKEVEGYTVDRGLSNVNRTVYIKDGKATVAFRGTDLKSKDTKWKDLGTDALILFGLQKFSSRFKNAVAATKKVVSKYGKDNVNLTGHSLGGSQALYVGKELGLPVISFNPGLSVSDVGRYAEKPQAETKIYTTGVDPISAVSNVLTGPDVEYVAPKSGNVHALSNFEEEEEHGSGIKHWIEIDGHHYTIPMQNYSLSITRPLKAGRIYKMMRSSPHDWSLVDSATGEVHGTAGRAGFTNTTSLPETLRSVEKKKTRRKKIIKKDNTIKEKIDHDMTWKAFWSSWIKGKKCGSKAKVHEEMRKAAAEWKKKKESK